MSVNPVLDEYTIAGDLTFHYVQIQRLFTDNDQLLSEEAAAAIQHSIKKCRYVNFPDLKHYTVAFGTEDGPARESVIS